MQVATFFIFYLVLLAAGATAGLLWHDRLSPAYRWAVAIFWFTLTSECVTRIVVSEVFNHGVYWAYTAVLSVLFGMVMFHLLRPSSWRRAVPVISVGLAIGGPLAGWLTDSLGLFPLKFIVAVHLLTVLWSVLVFADVLRSPGLGSLWYRGEFRLNVTLFIYCGLLGFVLSAVILAQDENQMQNPVFSVLHKGLVLLFYGTLIWLTFLDRRNQGIENEPQP